MTFYSALAKTALRLIKSKGQAMTLVRGAVPVYNPATSTATSAATTSVVVYGTVKHKPQDESAAGRRGDGMATPAGLEVVRGDKVVTIGSTYEPTLNDTLTIGGVKHTILSIEAVAPAGVAVVYKLDVRANG